jgi:antitoxin HigA-1
MIRVPTSRTPTHPGEMLLEEFLIPMKLTQRDLAGAIHVPYQRVNDIINGRRGITPSTALRLAKFFGLSPDFWMNLQFRRELYFAQKEEPTSFRTSSRLYPSNIRYSLRRFLAIFLFRGNGKNKNRPAFFESGFCFFALRCLL